MEEVIEELEFFTNAVRAFDLMCQSPIADETLSTFFSLVIQPRWDYLAESFEGLRAQT